MLMSWKPLLVEERTFEDQSCSRAKLKLLLRCVVPMSKFTESLILLYNRTGWPLIIEDSIAFYDYPLALNEFQRDFGRVQKIISTELSDINFTWDHIQCNAAKEVKISK